MNPFVSDFRVRMEQQSLVKAAPSICSMHRLNTSHDAATPATLSIWTVKF
jgi:hypothetical protein